MWGEFLLCNIFLSLFPTLSLTLSTFLALYLLNFVPTGYLINFPGPILISCLLSGVDSVCGREEENTGTEKEEIHCSNH